MYCIDLVRKQTQSVRKICARDKITQLLLLEVFFLQDRIKIIDQKPKFDIFESHF